MKKFFISLFIFVLGYIGAVSFPLLTNWDRKIKLLLEHKPYVNSVGAIRYNPFPLPHIEIDDVVIKSQDQASVFSITSKSAYLYFSIKEIFANETSLSNITLIEPDIQLNFTDSIVKAQVQDGFNLLTKEAFNPNNFPIKSYVIKNGRLTYQIIDKRFNKTINNVNTSFEIEPSENSLSLSFNEEKISINFDVEKKSDNQAKLSFDFKSDLGKLLIEGSITELDTNPQLKSKLSGYINSPRKNSEKSQEEKMEVNGTLLVNNQGYDFKDISCKSSEMESNLNLYLQTSPTMLASIKGKIDKADLNRMANSNQLPIFDYEAISMALEVISYLTDGNISIIANEILLNNETIKTIQLEADITNKQLVIRSLSSMLPGETLINMNGVLIPEKEGNQPISFAGNISFASNKFINFAKWTNIKSEKFSFDKINNFSFITELKYYDEKLAFNNLTLSFNDSRLQGNFTLEKAKDKKQTVIHVQSPYINLDDLLTFSTEDKSQKNLLQLDSIEWLRRADVYIGNTKVQLSAEKLLFKDKLFSDFYLDAELEKDLFKFIDFRLKSQLGNTRLNGIINTYELKPHIEINIEADRIDTKFFADSKTTIESATEEKKDNKTVGNAWLKTPIDLSILTLITGNLNFSTNEFIYDNWSVANLKLAAQLKDNSLNILNLDSEVLESRLQLKGNIGVVGRPTASLTFTIANANLHSFLSSTLNIENIKGRFSASGSLGTAGLSLYEMASVLQGNVIINARNIEIGGFSLRSVVETIPTLMTLKDFQRWYAYDLPKGSTNFEYGSGDISISSGIISIPGIQWRNPLTSNAYSKGSINLPEWSLDLESHFDLNAGNVKFPLVAIQKGPIGGYTTTWNEAKIQEFWENQFFKR